MNSSDPKYRGPDKIGLNTIAYGIRGASGTIVFYVEFETTCFNLAWREARMRPWKYRYQSGIAALTMAPNVQVSDFIHFRGVCQ